MEDDIDCMPATLTPVGIGVTCPVCRSYQEPEIELTEDDSGEFRARDADQFIECEECGQLLDIGWAGWFWHDDADAPH